MLDYLDELFGRYRARGVLIDANLLLLYFIGSYDRRQITSFKRTKVFSVEDFLLLGDLLHFFDRVVTTPHILTEVNGLSNQLPGKVRFDYYSTFGRKAAELEEREVAVSVAAEDAAFRFLGLTDAAIAVAASARVLVLSVDLDLVTHLQNRGIDALNFNHLRTLNWSR